MEHRDLGGDFCVRIRFGRNEGGDSDNSVRFTSAGAGAWGVNLSCLTEDGPIGVFNKPCSTD